MNEPEYVWIGPFDTIEEAGEQADKYRELNFKAIVRRDPELKRFCVEAWLNTPPKKRKRK